MKYNLKLKPLGDETKNKINELKVNGRYENITKILYELSKVKDTLNTFYNEKDGLFAYDKNRKKIFYFGEIDKEANEIIEETSIADNKNTRYYVTVVGNMVVILSSITKINLNNDAKFIIYKSIDAEQKNVYEYQQDDIHYTSVTSKENTLFNREKKIIKQIQKEELLTFDKYKEIFEQMNYDFCYVEESVGKRLVKSNIKNKKH